MQHYQRLRDLREDADLKQKNIYEFLGIGKNTYLNYEQGKREIPFELIIKLSKFYNVSTDYIAGLTNDKKNTSKKALKDDETELIENFNQLSERQKGEIEYHVKQLLEQRSAESEVG